MKSSHAPVHQIELRIASLAELFNSMDPTPFHHRDLDRDAVEFLESWALKFPPASHFRIIIHTENMPPDDPTPLVSEAMRNYFDYKSVLALGNLRLLLIEGRTSLVIGIGFRRCACSAPTCSRSSQPILSSACSRRACSSEAGLRCGGRCRYSSTTGGRSCAGEGSIATSDTRLCRCCRRRPGQACGPDDRTRRQSRQCRPSSPQASPPEGCA